MTLAGKTFFQKNGVWTDTKYDGKQETLKIKKFSPAYFKLLKRVPKLSKYLSLGDEVMICLKDVVLEITDEGRENLSKTEWDKIRY